MKDRILTGISHFIEGLTLRIDEASWRDPNLEEIDRATTDAVAALLRRYVEPCVESKPTILVIGFGYRVEEIIALDSVLHPQLIIASEPGPRRYIGFPKWRGFLNRQSPQEKGRLNEAVRLVNNRFQEVPDCLDVVVSFSLDKSLQGKEEIAGIISKSKPDGLIVLTAHKTGVYSNGVTDATFIDRSICQQPGIRIIQRMERLNHPPINDGYLWLLKKEALR